MTKKIRIAVSGANGKMGKKVIENLFKFKNIKLTSVLIKKKTKLKLKNKLLTKIYKKLNFSYCIKKIINFFDVLIDFTSPESSVSYAHICSLYKKKIVIGTTGFNIDQINLLKLYSKKTGIVISENYSIYANILFKLLKNKYFLNSSKNIKIIEKHHKSKIDKYSGTSIRIKKTILNSNNNQKNVFIKNIKIIPIRNKKDIGSSHIIVFFRNGESLTICHRVKNRSVYALGAIKSALWIYKKERGIFNSNNILKKN
ncbi:MAG: 4-hydroxy-tetrahydrodipicolinate reductase [Enterobacteriaceae bacterium]